MADQFINIAKPFLIGELTKQIKEHEKDFDVVESKIDSIITLLKTQLEPISMPIIATLKSIPFVDTTKKLQELSDELKLKMDGIDFSELENIPDINKTLTDRIKALPDKVKTKLKDLVDELVTGKKPPATTLPPPPSNTGAIMPPAPPSKIENAEATTTDGAEATNKVVSPTDTAAAAATSINDALKNMTDVEKKKTQHASFEGFINAGVFGNISELIAAAKDYENKQAAAAAGGAKRKHRRKTKKNIRRNNNGKTRFGRTF